MFNKSQNTNYLETLERRIKNDYLTWVEQFLDIMTEHLNLSQRKRVNDIGCNLGQFYKGMKRRNLNLDYYGYDIETLYLEKASLQFKEIQDRFLYMDISNSIPDYADISITSATFEHLDTLWPGLNNMLKSTKELVLIRTFLGEDSKKAISYKEGAEIYYYINQYSFLEVLDTLQKHGFSSIVLRDRYSDSLPQYLRQGIVRTHFIVLGKRA
jgi:SAM-dependent methyltransferase